MHSPPDKAPRTFQPSSADPALWRAEYLVRVRQRDGQKHNYHDINEVLAEGNSQAGIDYILPHFALKELGDAVRSTLAAQASLENYQFNQDARYFVKKAVPQLTPAICSEILLDRCKRGYVVPRDVIGLLMDHGADPTFSAGASGGSALQNQPFTHVVSESYLGHREVVHADKLAQFFTMATHPNLPQGKRMAVHQIVLDKMQIGGRDSKRKIAKLTQAIGPHAAQFSDIGRQGEPDPFLCMMHVLSSATLCGGGASNPDGSRMGHDFTEKEPSGIGQYDCGIAMLRHHSGNWVEQSRKLSGITLAKIFDVGDMLDAFAAQVILPCVRFHLSEETLSHPSLQSGALGKLSRSNLLKEALANAAYPELARGKSLFEMLELSEKWHRQAAAMDNRIRTIERNGQCYPLLQENEPLRVPDDIAKGWTVRNITNVAELERTGQFMRTCIGGKADGLCDGDYHVFVFSDPQGLPVSSWRASMHFKTDYADSLKPDDIMPGSIPYVLKCEDRTGVDNERDFSPQAQAAFQWFKSSVESGAIALQSRDAGETPESKFLKSQRTISALEDMIGFPLTGEKASALHQNAFESWASAHNAVIPTARDVPEPPATLPFTQKAAIQSGAYAPIPDIGTMRGKFLVNDRLNLPRGRHARQALASAQTLSARDASVEAWHYGNGQDKIMRKTLESLSAELPLLPKRNFAFSARVRTMSDDAERSRA